MNQQNLSSFSWFFSDQLHADYKPSDNDRLLYVDGVVKDKLLESVIPAKQATSNTKEQF